MKVFRTKYLQSQKEFGTYEVAQIFHALDGPDLDEPVIIKYERNSDFLFYVSCHIAIN